MGHLGTPKEHFYVRLIGAIFRATFLLGRILLIFRATFISNIIFFPQIFLENLPSCFTVLAEKGARVKIGGEGGLMGQNTPTESSRQKLHKKFN